jgi:transcriptional regulator with XRE-family HTH domain
MGSAMATDNGLAAKVDTLIKAAGGPSYEVLAREIKAAGGPTVSAAYLWQLRTGSRDNPTFQHLQALARFFSKKLNLPITLQYFDPETAIDQPWRDAENAARVAELNEEGQEEQRVSERLAEQKIRRISARYGEMGPSMLREILDVMDHLAAEPDKQDVSDDSTGRTPNN